jgi:hypothetical protein
VAGWSGWTGQQYRWEHRYKEVGRDALRLPYPRHVLVRATHCVVVLCGVVLLVLWRLCVMIPPAMERAVSGTGPRGAGESEEPHLGEGGVPARAVDHALAPVSDASTNQENVQISWREAPL